MATLIKHFDYPCSIDEVFGKFATDECFRKRLQEQGASDIVLESQTGAEFNYTFRVKRELPQFVPKLMRSQFSKLSDVLLVRQKEIWAKESEGRLVCRMYSDLDQFKVKVENTSTYTACEGGCVNNLKMKVSCDLPLIGNKLSKFIRDDNDAVMDREHLILMHILSN